MNNVNPFKLLLVFFRSATNSRHNRLCSYTSCF